MMGRREQHHNSSGRNEKMERNERRRKQFLLPQMSLKASLGEGSDVVVGKPTTKRVSLLWAYGKHLKIMR